MGLVVWECGEVSYILEESQHVFKQTQIHDIRNATFKKTAL